MPGSGRTRLLGTTTPRLWTPPLVIDPPGPCGCGCALTPATSLGYSAVEFATDVVGIRPLPWQRWLLIHALELRPDGSFRFRTVLVLVARQNGKTSLVELKNLWKMYVLEIPLVIGTAQDLDTAEESWDKAVEIAEGCPELAAEVRAVDKTNGKKSLKLANGSRWKIKAASRRGGRGLSGDDVNLDELREHQNWLAWGAVTKTTMARANAQIWAYSNAGDDKSVVLNQLQEQGRATVEDGAESTLGHFEWSAPDEVECTCGRPGNRHTAICRLQDRRVWAQANPSLGYTITEEAIASALSTDPEEIFRTEVLCQRVPDLGGDWTLIPQDAWLAVLDPDSRRTGEVAFALDVTPSRDAASIAVYGLRADGIGHVEVVDHRPGTDWVVKRLVQLKERWNPVAIGLDVKGPAGSLFLDLEKAGIKRPDDPEQPRLGDLAIPTVQEVAAACGQFYDAVVRPKDAPEDWEPTVRHIGQAPLTAAVRGVKTRTLSDAWAWGRRVSNVDISPLVACTYARWAYETRAHLINRDYDVLASVF